MNSDAALWPGVTEPAARIVFAPLRRFSHLHRVFMIYSVLAAIGTVMAALRGGNVAIWLGGNLALAAIVFGALAFFIQRSIALAPRRMFGRLGTPMGAGATPDFAAGWAAYNFVRPSIRWGWYHHRSRRWNEIVRTLRDAGSEPPATIAEESIRGELEAIPMVADLIEPEFIVSSRPLGRAAYGFMLVYFLFMFAFSLVSRSITNAAIFGVLLLSTVVSAPRLKKWFPALREEGRAPVAAPGIVRDAHGRRWVRNQAVLVVQRTRSKGPVWATLVGPLGLLRLSFASARDPDFINLWQRWNHPHPRPELLTE